MHNNKILRTIKFFSTCKTERSKLRTVKNRLILFTSTFFTKRKPIIRLKGDKKTVTKIYITKTPVIGQPLYWGKLWSKNLFLSTQRHWLFNKRIIKLATGVALNQFSLFVRLLDITRVLFVGCRAWEDFRWARDWFHDRYLLDKIVCNSCWNPVAGSFCCPYHFF